MERKITTVNDAAHEWVREFNRFPEDMISKLMEADPDSWMEITRPTVGNTVELFDIPTVDEDGDEYYGSGREGEIVEVVEDGKYIVELYGDGTRVTVEENELEVEREEYLPMWGWMWQFGDDLDVWWLEEKGGLQIMSDCGFRVYQSDDWGYFFGIDGCGYDFYTEHWCPLYLKRGLQWHETKEEMNNK